MGLILMNSTDNYHLLATLNECIKVIVSGRVQGVGFRYTVLKHAEAFKIKGYVKNLYDGTVEIVIKKDKKTIDKFIKIIKNLPYPIQVDKLSLENTVCEEFKRFEIRY